MLIPATHRWNALHGVSRAAVESARCAVDHVLVESYSLLTRMPEPGRLPPQQAAEAIRDAVHRTLSLPDEERIELPTVLAERGIAGGATYDALIALTAAHHGATLLSLDARAARTYRACGVEFELLTA